MATRSYAEFKEKWKKEGKHKFQVVVDTEIYLEFMQVFGRYKLSESIEVLMRRALERELSGLDDTASAYRQEIKHVKGSISLMLDHPVIKFTSFEVELIRLLINMAGPLEAIVDQWMEKATEEELKQTSPQALANRQDPSITKYPRPKKPTPHVASRRVLLNEAKTESKL